MLHGGGHWLPHRPDWSFLHIEIPQAVRDIYPDLAHAPNWEEAIAATSFVARRRGRQFCDALGLVGTPEYCAERIAEMSRHGVTNLYLMTLQTFVGPERILQAFREVVLPRLALLGSEARVDTRSSIARTFAAP